MDYETYEQSVASGKPVEGYDLAMGTTHWRITPNDDFVYQSYTYSHAACKRSRMRLSSNVNKDSIKLQLPLGHPLAAYCVQGVPDFEITLKIYRGHEGFFIQFWSGTFSKISFNEDGIPNLIFEPSTSEFPISGGRRRCQRLCDLKLFGFRCGLNKENYKIEGTIDSVDGLTIVSDDFEDANWSVGKEQSGIEYGDITKLSGCVYNASSMFLGPASRAFDDNFNTKLILNAGNQWVSCQWSSPKIINCVKINTSPIRDAARYVKIEASNNGTGWSKLSVNQWLGDKCQQYNTDEAELLYPMYASEFAELRLNNSSSYTYYRVYTSGPWSYTRWWGSKIYITGFCEIQMTYTDALEGDYPELVNGLAPAGTIKVGDEERTIMSHQGDTITINRLFRDVEAGNSFVAYAGCDHHPNTCRFKFGNIPNYGGNEFLPVKNPYIRNIFY